MQAIPDLQLLGEGATLRADPTAAQALHACADPLVPGPWGPLHPCHPYHEDLPSPAAARGLCMEDPLCTCCAGLCHAQEGQSPAQAHGDRSPWHACHADRAGLQHAGKGHPAVEAVLQAGVLGGLLLLLQESRP